MELQIIDLLITTLKASPAFVSIVGNDSDGNLKLFPLLGDEGTTEPYVNYRVDEIEQLSKDGGRSFMVTLGFAFDSKSYLKALELKGLLETLLTAVDFEYIVPGVIDTDPDDQRIVGSVFFETMRSQNN